MIKVLIIIGTRPEAHMMAPLIHQFRLSSILYPLVCVISQYRELVQKGLRPSDFEADIDLNIMSNNTAYPS